MALIKMYSGSDVDFEDKEFEEGALYYIFPNSNMYVGHIYADIDGVRREISASYNDSALTNRMKALEDALLAPCTSLILSEGPITTWVNASETIVATITPRGTTDKTVWSVSNNCAEVVSQSYNAVTGEETALVTGLSNGWCTITCTCGNQSDSIDCLVLDENYYVDVLLAEDYDPNRQSFSWNLPSTFTFDHGQYIEASFDISGITTVKENLISLGVIINDYQLGPVVNFYTSQSVATIPTKLRIGSASEGGASKFTGLEINLSSTTVVIRMDATGLYVNGVLLKTLGSQAQANTLDIVTSEMISNVNQLKIGSMEGAVRSDAHYNYIKYVYYGGAL